MTTDVDASPGVCDAPGSLAAGACRCCRAIGEYLNEPTSTFFPAHKFLSLSQPFWCYCCGAVAMATRTIAWGTEKLIFAAPKPVGSARLSEALHAASGRPISGANCGHVFCSTSPAIP